jgi:tripartite-type tricarboxylate transporter receptor subunit TctC
MKGTKPAVDVLSGSNEIGSSVETKRICAKLHRRVSIFIREPFMNTRLALLAAGLAMISSFAVCAQTYPAKPVRIVVPFAAGSVPDVVARLPAEKLAISLGQPVLVENRAGAGGRIAAEYVSRQAPDGYTLLLGTASTHVVGPFLVKNMPYDPIKDFTPITAAVAPVNGMLVNPSVPANSVKELVAYAKANPGKIAFGSNGIGSSSHLLGELVNMTAGVNMLHVPYAGSNEVLNALLSGQVQLTFSSAGSVAQYLTSGKLKLLAILLDKRYPPLPKTPTLAEALPGYEQVTDWFGFFGPANLPVPILSRLHSEIVKALNVPDVRSKLDSMTMLIMANTPDEFAAMIKREAPIFGRVIKASNIPMQ